MKVLLLDDDPIQLDVCRNWLQGRGHTVACARSGEEAQRHMANERFDVAVLDWLVPGLSGQDVLAWIRRHRPEVPVLFATACGEDFEVASILELGADDYVVKPLRRLEFVARVEALARRAARPAMLAAS